MAENIRRNQISDTNSLSRSPHASSPHSKNKTYLTIDDVILSLSKAHENRRARQVVEWERTQATNSRRST